MKRTTRTLAALGATLALGTTGAVAATTAADAAGSQHGCSYGSVCIYPSASWAGTPISFSSYGAHKIYNLYGKHRIFNNQYGGAISRGCKGGNGTSCDVPLKQNMYDDKDMTPLNSILLAR